MAWPQHIVMIGSGRLAHHLAAVLSASGKFRLELFNHKRSAKALSLAKRDDLPLTTNYKDLPASADLYIICVSDSAIPEVALQLKKKKISGMVVHTSGTVDLDVLKPASKQTGVLYPLQTFSADDTLHWKHIPLLIEANSKQATTNLKRFSLQISPLVHVCKPGERLKMHMAAVITNNFSNAMYTLAFDFVKQELSAKATELLKPLIRQTVQKLEHISPQQAQTGPAVRGDKQTIQKHLKLLGKYPQTQKVYKLMTDLIAAQQGKK